MKKILQAVIMVMLSGGLHAQLVLNPQLPATGMRSKLQLWNLSVINTTNDNLHVVLEMTMTDVSNNQRVLSGVTRSFQLSRGVKQLQPSDVMPVTYNTGSLSYNVDLSPQGLLPVGVFNVCYALITQNSGGKGLLAEACEMIEIEPLSPPQLVMPADSDRVDQMRPVFSWLPPSPPNQFSHLVYDLVLIEVQPGQTAADALERNIPLLKQHNITHTFFQYPVSSPELDSTKLYAWGVVAKNNLFPVASSEVWTFRLRSRTPAFMPAADHFVALKSREDASFIVCNGLLRYEYENEINDSSVQVNIYDITGAEHQKIRLPNNRYSVRFGQNLMQLDLQKQSRFTDQHVYLLELVNARNERSYIKFEYRKQD